MNVLSIRWQRDEISYCCQIRRMVPASKVMVLQIRRRGDQASVFLPSLFLAEGNLQFVPFTLKHVSIDVFPCQLDQINKGTYLDSV